MTGKPAFAAVDWGTSSFRLWLMGRDGTIFAERRSGEGMATLARTDFPAALARHLRAAAAPEDLPVIVCGMAGSRQGWLEVPYIDVPAPLHAITRDAAGIPDAGRPVFILPGFAQRIETRADVMRGEETQLLGAVDHLDGEVANGLFCMPGTHSKWVRLEDETVTGFSTFMTGELFAAMAQHSILAHALAGADDTASNDRAFADAVLEASREPALLTHKLFTVRGSQLLFGESAEAAKGRLSGLLIGTELAASGALGGEPVFLIASGRMRVLYEAAFAVLGIAARTIDADDSVRRGLRLAAEILFFDTRNAP